MKARVLVTLDCPRNCTNCCNKEEVFNQAETLTELNDLLNYEEIIITGGEPMLIPKKTLNFIHWLKDSDYEGKIYLHSALYNHSLLDCYGEIISLIDGIHYTVHYEATDKEIKELKELSESWAIKYHNTKSLRLAIDKRLYDKYDFSNIDFLGWSVIRKLEWKLNCPLPDNEKLFIYEL